MTRAIVVALAFLLGYAAHRRKPCPIPPRTMAWRDWLDVEIV